MVTFGMVENGTQIDYVLISKLMPTVYTKCEGNPWCISICIAFAITDKDVKK